MPGGEREATVIRSGLLVALAIAFLSLFGNVARAFPDRPIKLVVPFPAGGATDTAARLVARGTSTVLGQPILIENQGGAGGTIALKQVIGAPADGYTLMSVGVSSTFVTQMILFNLDFDPAKLLTPVALTTIDAVDGAHSAASECHRVVASKRNHIEGSRPWARLSQSGSILRSRCFRFTASMRMAR